MKPITNEAVNSMGTEAVLSSTMAETRVNPLANVWLGLLAVVFGLTLFCTAVLVAWPVLAYIGAKFF